MPPLDGVDPAPVYLVTGRISTWWMAQAQDDVDATIRKLSLYGPLDFHGQAIAGLIGRRNPPLGWATEAAIASYVMGKAGRIAHALATDMSTEAHWDDVVCYGMMARYVRRYGAWP